MGFLNADSVHSGVSKPFFHLLDIFARPVNVNPILYSVQVTPTMILFALLAGIVLSICLPYFRKFNVTGINSGPFHTTLLLTIVGVVAGISVLFTLFGVFYEVLFLNKPPLFYHYIILDSVALSLCYAVGSYLGLERAEEMVRKELVSRKWSRVVEGSVTVNSE